MKKITIAILLLSSMAFSNNLENVESKLKYVESILDSGKKIPEGTQIQLVRLLENAGEYMIQRGWSSLDAFTIANRFINLFYRLGRHDYARRTIVQLTSMIRDQYNAGFITTERAQNELNALLGHNLLATLTNRNDPYVTENIIDTLADILQDPNQPNNQQTIHNLLTTADHYYRLLGFPTNHQQVIDILRTAIRIAATTNTPEAFVPILAFIGTNGPANDIVDILREQITEEYNRYLTDALNQARTEDVRALYAVIYMLQTLYHLFGHNHQTLELINDTMTNVTAIVHGQTEEFGNWFMPIINGLPGPMLRNVPMRPMTPTRTPLLSRQASSASSVF